MNHLRGRGLARTMMLGTIGSIWGIAGVLLLLGSAIYRLVPIGSAALAQPLAWYHWLVLVGWVALMAHSEGYRGFQKGFSPRVAARAAYLRRNATWLRVLLAPLFCIGYFHATRRRQIVAIALTAMVICFIIIAHQLTQPWRGIVDIGVVVGLAWGVTALLVFSVKAFSGSLDHSPEVPGEPGIQGGAR